jgi:hypothetical protein
MTDPIAVFNERIKLIANSVNALGIGLVGFAILRPITINLNNIDPSMAWWVTAGLALHAVSLYILGYTRRKDDA